MASLFNGIELQKKDGSKTQGEEALKEKIVGIYFSAHWCCSCRYFTPILKTFYDGLIKNGLPFEIVFISWDKTAEELQKYMEESHGDWYFLPFGNEKKEDFFKKFEIDSIPRMVIVKANGDVITHTGREDVEDPISKGEKSPAQVFEEWKSEVIEFMEN